MQMGNFYALLGAAIAVLVSGIGSAIGVGRAGQAATAMLSKQPEKFGSAMTLTVMPSTQALYGFVVGFMVLIKLGALGDMTPIDVATGWSIFAYCLPVGFVGLGSAIMQGSVVVGSLAFVAKQDKAMGKSIPLVILVEMFAIFAFIISLLGVLMLDVVPYVAPVA